MLTTYPGQQRGTAPIDVSKTWWIDLLDPTPARDRDGRADMPLLSPRRART
ncbi:MAG: hypothetical protein WDN31_20495 [Hyphomicrobium sp.]